MTFSPLLPIWRAPVRRLALMALGLAAAPAFAIGCDELRSSIDARIRATGVVNFSLSVVAASFGRLNPTIAPPSGAFSAQIRPLCAVTIPRAMARPKPAPAQSAKPKAAEAELITECDDGTSVTHGECKH